MSDTWDDMRKAKENSYFEEKNKEALTRMAKKREDEAPRPSPITGEPMTQEVILGVVIDRCQSSGGIWLDAGELEELIAASKEHPEGEAEGGRLLGTFLKGLTGGK